MSYLGFVNQMHSRETWIHYKLRTERHREWKIYFAVMDYGRGDLVQKPGARQQLLDFWRGTGFGNSVYGDKFSILPDLGKGSNSFYG